MGFHNEVQRPAWITTAAPRALADAVAFLILVAFVYQLIASAASAKEPLLVQDVAARVDIVVAGASNTAGWGVGSRNAFPALLEARLRARDINAYVRNAGVVGSTTAGMLRRVGSAAPAGTDLVILQPGGNDLRFFGSREQRQANIKAIERLLNKRGIRLIVFDPVFPQNYFSWDGIHFTAAAHAQIAAQLEPMVIATLKNSR